MCSGRDSRAGLLCCKGAHLVKSKVVGKGASHQEDSTQRTQVGKSLVCSTDGNKTHGVEHSGREGEMKQDEVRETAGGR